MELHDLKKKAKLLILNGKKCKLLQSTSSHSSGWWRVI